MGLHALTLVYQIQQQLFVERLIWKHLDVFARFAGTSQYTLWVRELAASQETKIHVAL